MLWMAVTADRYELPMIVEQSATALAKKLGVTRSTILIRSEYREGAKRKYKARGTKYGMPYRVVKVEE